MFMNILHELDSTFMNIIHECDVYEYILSTNSTFMNILWYVVANITNSMGQFSSTKFTSVDTLEIEKCLWVCEYVVLLLRARCIIIESSLYWSHPSIQFVIYCTTPVNIWMSCGYITKSMSYFNITNSMRMDTLEVEKCVCTFYFSVVRSRTQWVVAISWNSCVWIL